MMRPQNNTPDQNAFDNLVVGQWQEKLGAITQGTTMDDFLSNMADAIQLMENEIGSEPRGFWIGKTVDEKEDYAQHSWERCAQLVESAGYRLARETQKHKKFKSPTWGGGLGGTSLGGFGGMSPGADISMVSSVIIPVQEKIDGRIIHFYKQLVRRR